MIFEIFPEKPEIYSTDMRDMVTKTIERHGIEEWRAGVLTNEIHGHLGIYAIIGVKMGIYALEILGAKAGDVKIISSAGIKPPVSCMNDGLQVSTGATLGHGLIESIANEHPKTEALFCTKEKNVLIKLQDSISKMIVQEIDEAIKCWGHAPEYWHYVRKLAVKYWYELDRKVIFNYQNL